MLNVHYFKTYLISTYYNEFKYMAMGIPRSSCICNHLSLQ